jgi:protein ImuB
MQKRYMSIWFRHLLTDAIIHRKPELKEVPFVLAAPSKNRMVITASAPLAEVQGVFKHMAVADARAALTDLLVMEDTPGRAAKLLRLLALWCIRYTPAVAIDLPDGLIMDISGCAHLWGGERNYLKELVTKLRTYGFNARAAIADTTGAAWAIARYGTERPIIPNDQQANAIAELPPAALRLEDSILDRLHKLGFKNISPLLTIPPSVLRRRFGPQLLLRLDQTLGRTEEHLTFVVPPVPYIERLPCLEPISTAGGITIAIEQLLTALCQRLRSEGKGLRKATIKCHRVDGVRVQVSIATNRGTHSISHLMKLFDLQISKIEPALGIELFILEAPRVEDMTTVQEQIWALDQGLDNTALAELLDRIAGKVGADSIKRFLPAEHHWPERSVKLATSLNEQPDTQWPVQMRPIRLLPVPELIEVMALVPDHPPRSFTHKGKRHQVIKADGPERIGREWWIEDGEHRDYYVVEDSNGQRYWVFRSGHYDSNDAQWYLHGYFA